MKFSNIALCAILFISLATAGSAASSCCPGDCSESDSQSSAPAKASVASEAMVTEPVAAQPQAVAKPKMLEFGSKQCKACKAMEPVMESLKKSHSEVFDIEFIDVWLPENQLFAKSHNISTIPTQVFLDSAGKELSRNTGFFSEESVLARWRELGVNVDAKTPDAPAND